MSFRWLGSRLAEVNAHRSEYCLAGDGYHRLETRPRVSRPWCASAPSCSGRKSLHSKEFVIDWGHLIPPNRKRVGDDRLAKWPPRTSPSGYECRQGNCQSRVTRGKPGRAKDLKVGRLKMV